jgi:hypothetical protein
MLIVAVLVGLALLLFGRQLFWLFVGGVGFVAGMSAAHGFLQGQAEWLILLVAVLAGLLGAVLSVFLQRVAIGLAGFVAGGYALFDLAQRIGQPDWAWIAFILGGILGAVLTMVLFDWALIVLSAMTGAIVIVENAPLQPSIAPMALLGLFILGIAVQAAQIRRHVPAQNQPVSSGQPK